MAMDFIFTLTVHNDFNFWKFKLKKTAKDAKRQNVKLERRKYLPCDI